MIDVQKYRELMSDHETTDEKIQERLDYLEALCQNVIRIELEKTRNSDKNASEIISS